jgi:hypothetical protein
LAGWHEPSSLPVNSWLWPCLVTTQRTVPADADAVGFAAFGCSTASDSGVCALVLRHESLPTPRPHRGCCRVFCFNSNNSSSTSLSLSPNCAKLLGGEFVVARGDRFVVLVERDDHVLGGGRGPCCVSDKACAASLSFAFVSASSAASGFGAVGSALVRFFATASSSLSADHDGSCGTFSVFASASRRALRSSSVSVTALGVLHIANSLRVFLVV